MKPRPVVLAILKAVNEMEHLTDGMKNWYIHPG